MKLFRNIHLVKVLQIPMQAITSRFYWQVRESNDEDESRKLMYAFKQGYEQALKDLKIKTKDQPKGKRE